MQLQSFRHLFPFENHFHDHSGLRQHYIDEGRGDPVVMLHGNPTWSFMYRALLADLRSSNRVIAPDHIGCGLSDKPNDRRYNYNLEQRIRDLGVLLDALGVTSDITLVAQAADEIQANEDLSGTASSIMFRLSVKQRENTL